MFALHLCGLMKWFYFLHKIWLVDKLLNKMCTCYILLPPGVRQAKTQGQHFKRVHFLNLSLQKLQTKNQLNRQSKGQRLSPLKFESIQWKSFNSDLLNLRTGDIKRRKHRRVKKPLEFYRLHCVYFLKSSGKQNFSSSIQGMIFIKCEDNYLVLCISNFRFLLSQHFL